MCAIGEPSGPIENGTTYIVRPRIEPRNSSVSVLAHLGGVAPVVGRAGVVLVLGADEGAVLDAGHVARVGAREVGVRALGVGEPLEGAGVDELLAELVVLLGRAVAPVDRRRAGSARPPPRPRRAASGAWSARWWLASRVCGSPCLGGSRPVSVSPARPTLRRVRAGPALRRLGDDGQRDAPDRRCRCHAALAGAGLRLRRRARTRRTLKKAFFDPPQRVIQRQPLKGDAIARDRDPEHRACTKYVVEGTDLDEPPQGARPLPRDAAARASPARRRSPATAPPTGRRSGTSTS